MTFLSSECQSDKQYLSLSDSDLNPIPLPSELLPVAEFPMGLIPASMRPWVADISERMGCPADYVAVTVMTALGTVLGRKIAIRPQGKTDWSEVPNMWAMQIGRPGVMKSPAQEEGLKPLRVLEHKQYETFEADKKRFRKDKQIADMRSDAAKAEAKQTLKGNPSADVSRLLEVAQPDEPLLKRYVTTDSTVEALGVLLQQNPNGICVHRDELVSLLKTLDRDDKAADRGFYLTGWNGNSKYTTDRIGRGFNQRIDGMCISMLGSTQPGRISEYIRAAVKGGSGDDGLLQRFGLMVWPDPVLVWKNVDRTPDYAAREHANRIFDRLDMLAPADAGAILDEYTGAAYLRFDPEALELFTEKRHDLEACIRTVDSPALESHLAKYRKLIPTLALIDHLADMQAGPVKIHSVLQAISWSMYLEGHARRVYASGTTSQVKSAKVIVKKIRQGELEEQFTARDVYRRNWSGLDRQAVYEALEILVDYRWLFDLTITNDKGGRPTTLYEINPKVIR